MSKEPVPYMRYAEATVRTLMERGALLVTEADGKRNVMTIGWGTIGCIWGKPVFVVLVRPSRYTYRLLDDSGEFTVNVPPPDMKETAMYCGSVSGRDHDKFKEKNLTLVPGSTGKCPVIEECVVHYECRVVHRNDVVPRELSKDILPNCYPKGDYHRLYFGEILATTADEEAAQAC